RQHLPGEPLGPRQAHGGQVGDGGLLMTRDRVVDARLDAALAEVRPERVPARRADHVEVVDGGGPPRLGREPDRHAGQRRRVPARQRPPAGVAGLEPPEQDAADRRLDLVEPQVVAQLLMDVLAHAAVIPEAPASRGQLAVTGRDRAAVAEDREVLRGVEREAAGAPDPAHPLPAVRRPVRLARVLDEPDPVRAGQLAEAIQVRRVAVQVDREEPGRARGDLPGGVRRIHRAGRVDVDEHGSPARREDRLDRRERGQGRDEHLAARWQLQGAEHDRQSRGPGRDQDGVAHADVLGELGLEGTALGPEDVPARAEGAQRRRLHLAIERHAREGDHAPSSSSATRRPRADARLAAQARATASQPATASTGAGSRVRIPARNASSSRRRGSSRGTGITSGGAGSATQCPATGWWWPGWRVTVQPAKSATHAPRSPTTSSSRRLSGPKQSLSSAATAPSYSTTIRLQSSAPRPRKSRTTAVTARGRPSRALNRSRKWIASDCVTPPSNRGRLRLPKRPVT